MPDQKISQLSSGTNAQAGDLFVIARGASNFNLTTAQLFNAPSAAATFASLAVDTSTLFVDAVNNRVGVLTATPGVALDVIGVTRTTTSFAVGDSYGNFSGSLLNESDTSKSITLAADPGNVGANTFLRFNVDGTERARLDASGNLGLGVTPSAWGVGQKAFEVGYKGNGIVNLGSVRSVNIVANAYNDGAWKYANDFDASWYQCGPGHTWYNAPSGLTGNAISFVQAMTLDASGNLVIGASSPIAASARLDVVSGSTGDYRNRIRNTTSGEAFLLFQNSDTGTSTSSGMIVGIFSDENGYVWNAHNQPMLFGTNNTERARITAAGSVVAGGSVALATTATDGFLYVPTCAGTPTGTPTAITGMAPIVVDTTNNKLYFYSGAQWRDAGP